MAKRKKPPLPDSPLEDEEENNLLRLHFEGTVLQLTPTTEYPFQLLQTAEYESWLTSITDTVTKARIIRHVDKMRRGLMGDWKEVGEGVFEMRMDFGPGYRAYYARYGRIVVILLGGGEKSGQQKDIAQAQRLWGEMKNEITEI